MVCPGFIKTPISRSALVGDGSRYDVMDQAQENGMAAEKCARKMIRAIAGKKREIYIGGMEIAGIYLKRWLPALAAVLVRNIKST